MHLGTNLETIKLINHFLNGSLSTQKHQYEVDSTPIKNLTANKEFGSIIPPPLDLATKEPKVAKQLFGPK